MCYAMLCIVIIPHLLHIAGREHPHHCQVCARWQPQPLRCGDHRPHGQQPHLPQHAADEAGDTAVAEHERGHLQGQGGQRGARGSSAVRCGQMGCAVFPCEVIAEVRLCWYVLCMACASVCCGQFGFNKLCMLCELRQTARILA